MTPLLARFTDGEYTYAGDRQLEQVCRDDALASQTPARNLPRNRQTHGLQTETGGADA